MSLQNPKVGFVSLGCPKALVDSERILTQLRVEGYDIVPTYDAADVVVVNTCGFIEAAKRESVDALLSAGGTTPDGRHRSVVAVGCMAERYGDELAEALPEADAVVGFGVPVSIGKKSALLAEADMRLLALEATGRRKY